MNYEKLHSLDPRDIYERGLADVASLSSDERIVYLLLELETYAAMEGWDHFFTTDKLRFYSELKFGLLAAGDLKSLAVLEDYERHLAEHGVSIEPAAIDAFLCEQDDDYFASGRDWYGDFDALTESRWKRVQEYFTLKGYAWID
jgi:hypothetical protein